MIIVDLRTHQVVDVPPDRTADTSANWMAKHPEIELSRAETRVGDYAAAARKAVPKATQTADRFHLLKNLGEALEGVLSRHLAAHRRNQAEQSRATPLPTTTQEGCSVTAKKNNAVADCEQMMPLQRALSASWFFRPNRRALR